MTQEEEREYSEIQQKIYQGILFNFQTFRCGIQDPIRYDLFCPAYQELREKYHLPEIAAEGTPFRRGMRILHHFSPRLTHQSWFAPGTVEPNALSLLDYSYEQPQHGINCLNKSKILVECCLAVGIYARRMHILPLSPYDMDNHVVVEIYDDTLEKWVMLDPSTDGWFAEEMGLPLSLLQMRERFAKNQFVTYLKATDDPARATVLRAGYCEDNTYVCKNLFRFQADCYNGFGEREERFDFVPEGYSVKANRVAKWDYCLSVCADQPGMTEYVTQKMEEERDLTEPVCSDLSVLLAPPERSENPR